MISEERKRYLREYRRKNRKRILESHRLWYEKNKDTAKCYRERRWKNRPNRPNRPVDLTRNTTNAKGRRFELLALSLLKGSKDENQKNFRGGYDISWNGMRIEVKMRNLNKQGYWTFTFKKGCTATHTLLFCVDKTIKRIILMPYNSEPAICVRGDNYKEYNITFSDVGVVNE